MKITFIASSSLHHAPVKYEIDLYCLTLLHVTLYCISTTDDDVDPWLATVILNSPGREDSKEDHSIHNSLQSSSRAPSLSSGNVISKENDLLVNQGKRKTTETNAENEGHTEIRSKSTKKRQKLTESNTESVKGHNEEQHQYTNKHYEKIRNDPKLFKEHKEKQKQYKEKHEKKINSDPKLLEEHKERQKQYQKKYDQKIHSDPKLLKDFKERSQFRSRRAYQRLLSDKNVYAAFREKKTIYARERRRKIALARMMNANDIDKKHSGQS